MAKELASAVYKLVATHPEVVIIAPCRTGIMPTMAAIDELARSKMFWPEFARSRQAVAIDGNHFVNGPSPGLATPIELFAAAIDPDLFPEPPTTEMLRLGSVVGLPL